MIDAVTTRETRLPTLPSLRRALPALARLPALPAACALALLLGAPPALAPVLAQGAGAGGGAALPSLGDAASEELSVSAERQLGDRIMRDIRRDPDLLDDPLLLEYVDSIWRPLLAASRARGDLPDELAQRYAWEAFLVRDRSVNAFALPGGYIGVHLGLISMTASTDELASVLAHEMSHVTQRHIARMLGASRRGSMLGLASIILGVLAASRSPDVANALIVGGQAVPAQAQLNFSRDMEREADRVGYGVLTRAGFAPAGMASMFDKLQTASRLNDSGGFPYLRSHPLTTERIGEARSRLGLATPPAGGYAELIGPASALHLVMQGRARALMDPRDEPLRRLASATEASAPAQASEALLQSVAAATAATRLKQWPAADAGFARALALTQSQPAARRAVNLMLADSLLERGEPQRALARIADTAADGSRAGLLLSGRAALALVSANGAPAASLEALRTSTQNLQSWVAMHADDAAAWTLLGQSYERSGQTLASVRAQAEAQLALGDTPGAVERLRAGQRLARRSQPDSIEASVIDARLRDIEIKRRNEQEPEKSAP